MAPDRESLEPEQEGVGDGPQAGTGDTDPGHDRGMDLDDEAGEDSDFGDEADSGLDSPPPGKMESWRKRSATGAMLTGLALGFQQVFEKEREEPAVIMTTSGDPPRALPVDAEVEHGRPRRSVVNIRPWLLGRGGSQPGSGGPTGAAGDATGTGEPTGTGDPTETDAGTGRAQPRSGSQPESD